MFTHEQHDRDCPEVSQSGQDTSMNGVGRRDFILSFGAAAAGGLVPPSFESSDVTIENRFVKYVVGNDGRNLHFDRNQFIELPVKVLVQESKTGRGRNITLKPIDYVPEE